MSRIPRRAVLRGLAGIAASFGLPLPARAGIPASPVWPATLPRQVLEYPEVVAAARAFVADRGQRTPADEGPSTYLVVSGWVLTEADLYAIGRVGFIR